MENHELLHGEFVLLAWLPTLIMLNKGIVPVNKTPQWLPYKWLSHPNLCLELAGTPLGVFLCGVIVVSLHFLLHVAVYKGGGRGHRRMRRPLDSLSRSYTPLILG